MRKIYTLILMLAMMFVGANSVSAQTSYTDDQGVVYSIDGTSATITGYTGSATELTINQKFKYGEDSITVTGFGDYAFENKTGITKIVLTPTAFKPELGEGTFKGCTGLKTLKWVEGTYSTDNTVHLLNNVIPKYCFQGCLGITEIKSRYKNSTLEGSCFKGCDSLKTVELGASCVSIASSAFSGCRRLTTVNFGGHDPSITEIADSAFYNCQNLTKIGKTKNVIALPKVTSIGLRAFYCCVSMKTIQLPLVESIGERAFYNGYTSAAAYKLETITGCENLTSIGNYAFYRCANLKTIGNTPNVVIFQNGLTEIGAKAFAGCDALVEVQVPWDTPLTITEDVFSATAYTSAKLKVPVGTEDAYAAATGWEKFTNVVTGIRTIENVENTVTNDAWYTVDGKRLQGEPATKGLYIHNGKKIVIK